MISSKLQTTIASKMKNANEHSINKIKAQFESINFNTMQLIFDPLIGKLCLPLKCCLKKQGFYKRPKILDKCEDTYVNELEIRSLLSKIRDTHAMVSNLQTRKHRELLKYTKDRVINIDSSSSDNPSSSSSEDKLTATSYQNHQ